MSSKKSIKKIISDVFQVAVWPIGVYLIFFILCKIFSTSVYGSWNSIRMVLTQTVPTTMLGWAMSGNMTSKRWDFSTGNMMIISCLLGVGLGTSMGFGPCGVSAMILIFGVLFGALNGLLAVTIKIPTLLLSVGLMKVYECIGYIYNKGRAAELRGEYKMFGSSPWIFVLLVVGGLVYYFLYSRSSYGRNYRALRDGQVIAVNNNINEKRNTFLCFVVAGLFVGLAAVCYAGMSGVVESSPSQNNSMNMMCAAFAPIFMGRYLSRHCDMAIGIFVGTLTMKLLTSGIVAVGLPSPMQNVGNAIFLIFFMAFSANQDRMNDWATRKKMAVQIKKALAITAE